MIAAFESRPAFDLQPQPDHHLTLPSAEAPRAPTRSTSASTPGNSLPPGRPRTSTDNTHPLARALGNDNGRTDRRDIPARSSAPDSPEVKPSAAATGHRLARARTCRSTRARKGASPANSREFPPAAANNRTNPRKHEEHRQSFTAQPGRGKPLRNRALSESCFLAFLLSISALGMGPNTRSRPSPRSIPSELYPLPSFPARRLNAAPHRAPPSRAASRRNGIRLSCFPAFWLSGATLSAAPHEGLGRPPTTSRRSGIRRP